MLGAADIGLDDLSEDDDPDFPGYALGGRGLNARRAP